MRQVYSIYCLDICNGTNSAASSGSIIQSPGYPTTDYPSSQSCQIDVQFPVGKSIVLDYLGEFEIDGYNHYCYYDFIEIFAGITTSSRSIAKHCGNTRPDEIKVYGNSIRIKFRSNGYGNGKGFSLRVTANDLENGKHHTLN